jgi:hypothetical protein
LKENGRKTSVDKRLRESGNEAEKKEKKNEESSGDSWNDDAGRCCLGITGYELHEAGDYIGK